MEKPIFRISVRELVEFILRSGDLNEKSGGRDLDAMQKGSRLHRKLQRQKGDSYRAEAALKQKTEYEDLFIQVEGRADGIFEKDGLLWIDEIKGILADPEELTEPVPVHKAQAMCYGAICAMQQNLQSVGIQMTYGNLDTEKTVYFREVFTGEQLLKWYQDLLKEYHKWVSFQQEWRQKRNASTLSLEFPFPYRKGQRQMVGIVYHSITEKRQVFIQAPTGVGKTMSTVFPAVRCMGEGKADILFYLTARTVARTVAEEAFAILKRQGLHFKNVTITAKEKMCLCEKMECTPENCPYAKGHFDRVNDAVYVLLKEDITYDREALLAHARKWMVCPFEMTLDLCLWADGVICDYNYVFDPDVCLKRFFGEGTSGNYVFLIDEAHNLVERGREMYSAGLKRRDVLEMRRSVKEKDKKLYRALSRTNSALLELEKETEGCMELQNPGALPLLLLAVQGEMDRILENPPAEGVSDEFLDFYFSVRSFLNIAELVDENYLVYSEKEEDGKCHVRLFCVNPALNLGKRLEKGSAAVFFSATFFPLRYYHNLLSIRQDDYGIYVESPFQKEKRCILTGLDVSSRYTRRGYEEYRKIARYIAGTVWQRKGNYMVFFPSYQFMEEVFRIYEEEFSVDWVHLICQKQQMTEAEREDFLRQFEEQGRTLAAFCILGGVFSEGIDLIGEKLIGAIIIGTGFPQISGERELLKKYFDRKGAAGFDYAYRYPGLNKVLQAAGRVIRSDSDTGAILLLDERFRQREYEGLFPEDWKDRKVCRLENLEKLLQEFWQRIDEKAAPAEPSKEEAAATEAPAEPSKEETAARAVPAEPSKEEAAVTAPAEPPGEEEAALSSAAAVCVTED